ncbi:MAG: M48 family metalloprotease [Candidatus Brocadiales bacterium]
MVKEISIPQRSQNTTNLVLNKAKKARGGNLPDQHFTGSIIGRRGQSKALCFVLLYLIIIFSVCTVAAEEHVGDASPLMSDEDEIEFGRVVDAEIRRHLGLCTSYESLRRLGEVGLKLVAVSDRKDLPFVFRILDSESINAFSAPGGYIYVTTGLLRFARNTDILAGILSHEVAHIALRHAAKMLHESQIKHPVLPDDPDRVEKMLRMFQYYRIEYEKEADLLGVSYAYKAGYNPNGLPDFMEAIMVASLRSRRQGFFGLILIHKLKWPQRIKALREYITTFAPTP